MAANAQNTACDRVGRRLRLRASRTSRSRAPLVAHRAESVICLLQTGLHGPPYSSVPIGLMLSVWGQFWPRTMTVKVLTRHEAQHPTCDCLRGTCPGPRRPARPDCQDRCARRRTAPACMVDVLVARLPAWRGRRRAHQPPTTAAARSPLGADQHDVQTRGSTI